MPSRNVWECILPPFLRRSFFSSDLKSWVAANLSVNGKRQHGRSELLAGRMGNYCLVRLEMEMQSTDGGRARSFVSKTAAHSSTEEGYGIGMEWMSGV